MDDAVDERSGARGAREDRRPVLEREVRRQHDDPPPNNAVAESFFSTLKTELVHDVIFTTKASATSTIAEWIEVFYNGQRRHSTLGHVAPAVFERRYYDNLNAAIAA